VTDVSHVAKEGFDVVPVRVEEIRGVVARGVVPVAGLTVRAKTGIDPGAMERVHVGALARVEADVEILRWRLPIDDVQVGEARPPLALLELRDPERIEDRLVEPKALRVVPRMNVDVIEDPERPVPTLELTCSTWRTRSIAIRG
jgi:hypothetical protein